MRVIIAADLHIHPHSEFDTGRPDSARLQDGLRALLALGEQAVEEGAIAIVIAGDLFHKRHLLAVKTLAAVYDCLQLLLRDVKEVHLLAGNHDQSSYIDTSLHVLEGPGIFVYEAPSAPAHLPFDFIPYQEDPEKWKVDLAFLRGHHKEGPRYLIAHQSIYGATRGNFEYCPPHSNKVEDVPPMYRHVFAGHYHPFQTVEDRWTYVGSLLQLDRSDAGQDKGSVLLDTETGEWKRLLSRSTPRFRSVSYLQTKVRDCSNDFLDVWYPSDARIAEVNAWAAQLGARNYILRVDPASVPQGEQTGELVPSKATGKQLMEEAVEGAEGKIREVGVALLREAAGGGDAVA